MKKLILSFVALALATSAFLKEQSPGCSVYAIGEAGLIKALYDAGITMNDVNPDYVVVGEGKNYSLDTLTKATNLVLGGARLIGANSDVTGTKAAHEEYFFPERTGPSRCRGWCGTWNR